MMKAFKSNIFLESLNASSSYISEPNSNLFNILLPILNPMLLISNMIDSSLMKIAFIVEYGEQIGFDTVFKHALRFVCMDVEICLSLVHHSREMSE